MKSVGRKSKTPLITDTSGSAARGNDALRISWRPFSSERAPAIIVLLTDGASNAGPLPVDAASEAAARGVRVYTIGFGTNDPNSERPPCGIQFLGNEPNDPFGFGGFGGGGGGFRRAIDEQTLMAVADATGGEYYLAASADELQKVFANLPTNLITKPEMVEVTVLFVALGAVLVALGILLGQAWRPLP